MASARPRQRDVAEGMGRRDRAEAGGRSGRAWTSRYDDYIRTTEPRHDEAVRKILQAVHGNGRDDIYLGHYEGLYCVPCEEYYQPRRSCSTGTCAPIHERPVEIVREENYFFRLSAYAGSPPRALRGASRGGRARDAGATRCCRSIRGGLQDLSISRTTFDWGMPLPWDRTHVIYVWFDALTNYITAAGYGDRSGAVRRDSGRRTCTSIGKDILRFHAVYWPAMLMAAGVEPPKQVLAHGFLTVGGKKMSKTNLTGIHPFELARSLRRRLLPVLLHPPVRVGLRRRLLVGVDGRAAQRRSRQRAGEPGGRVLAMLGSYFEGAVPAAGARRARRRTCRQ